MNKAPISGMPVIDLFAGPGGLGEGFSAYKSRDGHTPFNIALSIEKDRYAYQTLMLRSFYRQFPAGKTPEEYYHYLRQVNEPETKRRKDLFDAWSVESEKAEKSVFQAELGVLEQSSIRARIAKALEGSRNFILLGGPPCQAYSVMGRSRNSGNPSYRANEDKRQRLYVEYLQVLADHKPAVFIMENVKGLLSATLESQRIFVRILEDLREPCEAVIREDRKVVGKGRRVKYNLFPVGNLESDNNEDLRRFIVRMERHGVPQARHRVIILGIRSDLEVEQVPALNECGLVPGEGVIADLPRVRSGLSGEMDDIEKWRKRISEIRSCSFMKENSSKIHLKRKEVILEALRSICSEDLTRGDEFVKHDLQTRYRSDWYNDPIMEGICNHATRSHISTDLHRYLYAASYAKLENRSPDLRHFPPELLPNHRNAMRATIDGTFDDRFHVQLSGFPSTTVTSHLAKDGHYFIHPDPSQCRSMTVREVARLQTFPDNYFFCGPRTAQYIQVGNAVPPLLACQISALVFSILKECGLVE